MRIIEFIHDEDHPVIPSNVDIWVNSNPNLQSKKMLVKNIDLYPRFESYDLLILHGGIQHLWDKEADPWLRDEIAYVRQALAANIPVIGLCLGSQIIAEALEAQVFKDQQSELGFYDINYRSDSLGHPLFNNIDNGFTTFLYHSDHYQLPGDCISLAYTEDCPNQLFVSNIFPTVGFQFHPEYTKGIIHDYCQSDTVDTWMINGGKTSRLDFLTRLDSIPDTYPLFEQLIENSLTWLKNNYQLNCLVLTSGCEEEC